MRVALSSTLQLKSGRLPNRMNDNTHPPALIGVIGLLANLSLEQVNTGIAIMVGLATLIYMVIKILKELKNNKQ